MTEFCTIASFPDYEIDRAGNVRTRTKVHRKYARKLVSRYNDGTGRALVRLWVGDEVSSVGIARLVLETYVGPPPHETAAAKYVDGDRENTSVENLFWSVKGKPKLLTGETRVCLRCRKEFPKTHLRICPSCTETNARANPDFLYSGDSSPDFL